MICKYYRIEMAELYRLCMELYNLPGCGTGGQLHILLDDDNYTDEDLDWLKKNLEEHKDAPEYEIGKKILSMYSKMSIRERALFDSMWCGMPCFCRDITECDTCKVIDMSWLT